MLLATALLLRSQEVETKLLRVLGGFLRPCTHMRTSSPGRNLRGGSKWWSRQNGTYTLVGDGSVLQSTEFQTANCTCTKQI